MSIEEMMHEQQLVDREMKEIINDLGYKRFRGEEIDEEYERDCEIRIRKLKQDFNIWGSEVQKKEQAYEEEKYSAACRYMLYVTCNDEDDYIPLEITTDLPIEEPDNSLNMGDEHLDTIPATESDGSTDISKIKRKQSKTGKYGHGNQKSTKRSQRYKAEARKVKPHKKRHSPSLIGPIPKEECHVVERKAQVKKKIALVSLTKEAQAVTSRNDSLAILECTQFDQTATIEAPMIKRFDGQD
ncbi:hypothetical protein Tco_1153713 [Tanacetum coccineum]